jgi:hypothetical protein
MLKITPGNILLIFGGLVLGLGLAHTYLNFSLTKLAYQTRAEKRCYISGRSKPICGS